MSTLSLDSQSSLRNPDVSGVILWSVTTIRRYSPRASEERSSSRSSS